MPRKYTPEESAAAFWAKVDKNGPTMPHMDSPCWVWTAAKAHKGYGTVRVPGERRSEGSHRRSWILTHGDPGDLHVLHKCDNPPCVRPDHLFTGTISDNAQDMLRKGRGPRQGARYPTNDDHPAAKLTVAKVLEARRRRAEGETLVDLAKEYGVCLAAMYNAVSGRTWKNAGVVP